MKSVQNRKGQGGFTLIELIAVLVILGILAAVATPRFVNLQTEAGLAGARGVAGNLASATALNYAANVAGSTAVTVTTCEQTINATIEDVVPQGYTITGDSLGSALGDTSTCTVTHDTGQTATFQGIYVP